MRKFLALTAVALTLGAYPALANHTGMTAANADSTLKVNGLVCDFCAQAIHKVFTKHDTVNDVLVQLDQMRIYIDYKDGQSIDNDAVEQMVTDAGYTLVSIDAAPEGMDAEAIDDSDMGEAHKQSDDHDHDHSNMNMGE